MDSPKIHFAKLGSSISNLPRNFRSSAQSIECPQALHPWGQISVHTIHTPVLEASWECSLCSPMSLTVPGI